MERQLYRNGYKVLIGNSQNDPAKEENYLQQLLTHQVDGLIVGTQNRGLIGYQHANLPVVAIDQVVGKIFRWFLQTTTRVDCWQPSACWMTVVAISSTPTARSDWTRQRKNGARPMSI